jgi:hypothetical protein
MDDHQRGRGLPVNRSSPLANRSKSNIAIADVETMQLLDPPDIDSTCEVLHINVWLLLLKFSGCHINGMQLKYVNNINNVNTEISFLYSTSTHRTLSNTSKAIWPIFNG